MYGGFMITRDGVKLIEYNARFGDPEAMNILPLLKTDFIDVCRAIIDGTLDRLDIEFEKKATVCKYVVPKGYGLPRTTPRPPPPLPGSRSGDVGRGELYYSSIDQKAGRALHDLIAGDRRRRHRRRAWKRRKGSPRAPSRHQGPVDHGPTSDRRSSAHRPYEAIRG